MNFFGFLHQTTPEERAAKEEAARLACEAREAELARQHDDVVALRQGGIPTSARARLRELAAEPGAFTSDLAPDELALLRWSSSSPPWRHGPSWPTSPTVGARTSR